MDAAADAWGHAGADHLYVCVVQAQESAHTGPQKVDEVRHLTKCSLPAVRWSGCGMCNVGHLADTLAQHHRRSALPTGLKLCTTPWCHPTFTECAPCISCRV